MNTKTKSTSTKFRNSFRKNALFGRHYLHGQFRVEKGGAFFKEYGSVLVGKDACRVWLLWMDAQPFPSAVLWISAEVGDHTVFAQCLSEANLSTLAQRVHAHGEVKLGDADLRGAVRDAIMYADPERGLVEADTLQAAAAKARARVLAWRRDCKRRASLGNFKPGKRAAKARKAADRRIEASAALAGQGGQAPALRVVADGDDSPGEIAESNFAMGRDFDARNYQSELEQVASHFINTIDTAREHGVCALHAAVHYLRAALSQADAILSADCHVCGKGFGDDLGDKVECDCGHVVHDRTCCTASFDSNGDFDGSSCFRCNEQARLDAIRHMEEEEQMTDAEFRLAQEEAAADEQSMQDAYEASVTNEPVGKLVSSTDYPVLREGYTRDDEASTTQWWWFDNEDIKELIEDVRAQQPIAIEAGRIIGERLTGVGYSYRGPGQAFCNGAYACVGKYHTLVKARGGLDI